MNYICYNGETGRIIETGYVDEDSLHIVEAKNLPTAFFDEPVDYRKYKVDPTTKSLVEMTEEEIIGPLLPPPSVVGTPAV